MLSASDAAIARRAMALAGEGRAAEAQAELMRVSPGATSHPDVLFVASAILQAQGRMAEARRALEGALQQSPGSPQVWNAYGGLLSESGDHAAAIAAFRQGLARAPANAEMLRNLALTQLRAGEPDEAMATLEAAEAAEPGTVHALHIRAAIARASGRDGEAQSIYRQILLRAPRDAVAAVNLAASLREHDQAAEALSVINPIDNRIEALTLRAHLLADTGQAEAAVTAYRAAIAFDPSWLDAHETLARLLPQLGRADEALLSYDAALEQFPQSRLLHESAIVAARDLKDAGRLLRWSAQARARFGDDPMLALAHALGQDMAGSRSSAIDELRAILARSPGLAGAHNHLAPLLLAEGDLAGAEAHAQQGAQLAPLDQSGWAWLSVIWRLRGDAREDWLADYERLVVPVSLDLPQGIADALDALHTTQRHPAEQSVRGGTQTRGNLFGKRAPEIAALRDAISQAVSDAIAGLPDDAAHPFLGRKAASFAFAGSWSVRLHSEGFHIAHIHQNGWLSSACYIAVPMLDGPDHAGCLQFGVPDATLGLDIAPRRVVVPEPGRLVLFPSYFWHGTIPFTADSPRLTVAFDAIPA